MEQAISPKIKGEVLKKVYRVWLLRKLAPVMILEVVVFAILLYQLKKTVFVQRVMENALGPFFANPASIFSFTFSAFLNTSFLSKVLFIAIVIIFALLIRHATQGMLRLILVRENFFGRVKE